MSARLKNTMNDPDQRTRLTYEEYSKQLKEALIDAPSDLRAALAQMDSWIATSRAYTAPEYMNDGRNKKRLYRAFCKSESSYNEESSKWKADAEKFFKAFK
jgi:hypothetical protein